MISKSWVIWKRVILVDKGKIEGSVKKCVRTQRRYLTIEMKTWKQEWTW